MTHYFDEQVRQWENTIDDLLIDIHKWVRHNPGPMSQFLLDRNFIRAFNKMIENLREAKRKYSKDDQYPPSAHLQDHYGVDNWPDLVGKMERRIDQLQEYQDAVLAARKPVLKWEEND